MLILSDNSNLFCDNTAEGRAAVSRLFLQRNDEETVDAISVT